MTTLKEAYHLGAIFVEGQMDEAHRQWVNIEYHNGYCRGVSSDLDAAVDVRDIRRLRASMYEVGQLVHKE